jgi:TatD DNase family protein
VNGDQKPERPVHAGAVDTHCHLFLLEGEPSEVVEAARGAGVDGIVCVGVDAETSRRALDIARRIDGVTATAGVHPHDAATFDRRVEAEVEGLAADAAVVAVGETGLDFFRMRSPREDQLRAFSAQIAIARAVDKPIVVHVRDAWEAVLGVLDAAAAERVVLHCFSGTPEIARASAARGWMVSFAGNVTFPPNEHLRQAARAVPSEALLVETDSPFLSPQSRRGRDNEPRYLIETIQAVASIRGEAVDRVSSAISTNAEAVFPGLE